MNSSNNKVISGTMDRDTEWVRDVTPSQWANISLTFERGCNPKEEEYGFYVNGILGSGWTLEDFDILYTSVIDRFNFEDSPEEGEVIIHMEESGEWDGFPHWQKYFVIKSVDIVDYN